MARIRFRSGSSVSQYCPHPVGTYLHCTFNPNSEWSGTTWVQQGQGNYLVSAGSTYVSGRSYGSNTHTLSVSEMPSHSHGVYNIFGTGWDGTQPQGDKLLYQSVKMGRNASEFFGISSTGGSAAHNNMPQSIAVPLWLRTA